MKKKEIDSLTEQQAKKLLLHIFTSPHMWLYDSIMTQMKKLAKDIAETNIDFKEDSAPFKNFVTWADKSSSFSNNLEQIAAKMTADALKDLSEGRKAVEGSYEELMERRKKSND